MHHLKDDNGTPITDILEIAIHLVQILKKVRPLVITPKSSNISRRKTKKQNISFKTNKNLRYNKKFTMSDLKQSLKSPIIHLQAQIRSIMKFYATF